MPKGNSVGFLSSVIASFAVLAICVVQIASAQSSTASINGIVYDSTGAIVPDSSLILRNTATGVQRDTKTNGAGAYSFPDLQPGTYTLDAGGNGFARKQIAPFTLAVNQTATFNFTLAVGGVEQTVEVQATAARVEASTSELGSVVAEKQIVDLPLNGRNFTQLLSLQPGVSPVSVEQNGGGTGGLRSFINPSVNGQQNRSNNFLLDGMVNNSGNQSHLLPPIVDTLQEFKIQSHNDEAQFGGVTGGIINVVTKSGSNELHGSAWEYLRNNALDARSRFVPKVAPFHWNQFGAAGGGPVVIPKLYHGKNRTFFYGAYEGDRLRQPGTSLYRVPTDANYRGDFSDWPTQIYNPFSTRPDPNKPGAYIRDPFPGNQIPVSLFNKGMLYYAKTILPAPIATGVPNTNAIASIPTVNDINSYQARIDHNFSQRDFLYGRFSGRPSTQTSSGNLAGLVAYSHSYAKNFMVAYTHTFGPSAVLTVQAGRSWQPAISHTNFASLPSDFYTNSGLAQSLVNNYQITGKPAVPNFTVPSYFGAGESSNGPGGQTGIDNRQWKADFSKIIGRHTIKAGFEYYGIGFTSGNANTTVGFSNPQTANPQSVGNTGDPLASFFLGVPDNLTKRNVQESLQNAWIFDWYVQDQWKATSKLTLNFGLRKDKPNFPDYGTPEFKNQYVGNMDFNNGTYIVQKVPPACVAGGSAPCIPTPDGSLPAHVVSGKLTDGKFGNNNWGPRFGFAYQLTQTTVVRGGFGIFWDTWGALTQIGQNVQGVWPSTGQLLLSNLNYPTATTPTPTVASNDPYASTGANALWPSPDPFHSVQWYYDPALRDPYSIQWNFGVQHQFGSSSVLSVNYVGNSTHRVIIGTFYNTAKTPGPGDYHLRAPYPYIDATYWDRPWSRSNYEGLQIQFDKKYSNGLAFSASYTRSKAIDYGCSGYFGSEFCSSQDPYNIKNDRGVSGTDIPNMFSFNWVYELPIGRGKRFNTGKGVVDYVIGGWQVNGVTLLRSGSPYSVLISGDIANTGNQANYMRPNLVGNPNPANRDANQWLIKSAFAAPPAYTFGNLGRDTFRSDPYKTVDFSLFRQFPFKESRRLELRVEAFNVFNVTSYAAPNNNLSNANFGTVTALANTPRQMQVSAKIIF